MLAKPNNPSGVAQFPYLHSLIAGYFHQDFDTNGNTLEEIIAKSKEDSSPEEVAGTVADIHRFIKLHGHCDATLAEGFVSVFQPGVIAEGWDNMTTRQWLERIADLLNIQARHE